MNLVLNGEQQEVKAENIDELVNFKGLVREAVLIEHNGTALLRAEWRNARLAEGDQVEILQVAAGG